MIHRWLGGMLTNFRTISGRVQKMKDYERMKASGDFAAMPKKEALMYDRELGKLEQNLGGMRAMGKLPDALFVLDTGKEHIAVTEAARLGIPVVGVVDTNNDPDMVQFVIPGNDDAIRSTSLLCNVIAEAVKEGQFIGARRGTFRPPPVERSPEEEARIAAHQAEAARAAVTEARRREARVAAQLAATPDAADADSAAATPVEGEVAPVAEAVTPETAETDAAAPVEAAAPVGGAAPVEAAAPDTTTPGDGGDASAV